MYEPKPEHKFTFGLWTVGNIGRDPFGAPVREAKSPADLVYLLGEVGAYGVNFHDNDLIPIDATPAEAATIKKAFRKALDDTGLVAPMATTNLFADPAFKDGAFTANDPRVRAYALQKTMQGIDLGVEFGAQTYVFWGGREGTETDAAKDPVTAIKRTREAMNFLCEYVLDQGYDLRFALEAKPNEPRGDMYNATTGHMLAFIATLDHPEMVGVNPEVAHEHMAGLNFTHNVAQALDAGKLFHIDLNDQAFGRYDQDFRFGSVNLKSAFFLVKLLEDASYGNPRHFDAHAYRTEDYAGVKDFARGCMRTYLILKEKAAQFNADPEIQGLLAEINADDGAMGGLKRRLLGCQGGRAQGAPVRPPGAGRPRDGLRAAGPTGAGTASGRPLGYQLMETVLFNEVECVALRNSLDLSVLVSHSVGPRILSLRMGEGENLLAELPGLTIDWPGERPFRFYGGHRLWHAPEVPQRTYLPDDEPVAATPLVNGVRVEGPIEPRTGLSKALTIILPDDELTVAVEHTLTNHGVSPVTCAPWAITQLKTGGWAVLPQPTRRSDPDGLQPNRSLALWPYTDVASQHIRWGNRFVLVESTPQTGPLKLGFPNPRHWLGYWRRGTLFAKYAPYDPEARYLDRGASSQCYCNPDFLELETLGPEVVIAPGGSAVHREVWRVFGDVELEPTQDGAQALAELLGLDANPPALGRRDTLRRRPAQQIRGTHGEYTNRNRHVHHRYQGAVDG